jgi:DNA-binding NarL/FixJ family response regulator
MINAQAIRDRMRVLLVSDDDAFSSQLKPRLPTYEVLSLTESSVWVAKRAGLDVTRGVDAVMIDHQVTGRLQLGLYATLRPADGAARVPVIFTRSKLTATTGGFDHALDMYSPEDGGPDEAARLVEHVLGGPPEPPAVVQRAVPPPEDRRRATPPRATTRVSAPAATTMPAGAQRAGVSLGPGLMQRLALWSIATVLIGFTFWPLIGSGPLREVVYGPLQAFAGGSTDLGMTGMTSRFAR